MTLYFALLMMLTNSIHGFAFSGFPKNITLRGGVLHAIPQAIVEKLPDGTYNYSGFQIDLLERLQIFAKKDDVNLEFILSLAPTSYGDALDLVANDCNATGINENLLEDCNKFDIIVGDYYTNADRALRIEFSPPWLPSTITTVKLTGGDSGITSLSDANKYVSTVCLVKGAYLAVVVTTKFPNVKVHLCQDQAECIKDLKAEKCVLYPDDELQLTYLTVNDQSIQITRERFNTQYLVWVWSLKLPEIVRWGMKRWIYAAIQNATMDELYGKYFKPQTCPLGRAGSDCQAYCHPDHGQANPAGKCVCDSAKWTGDDCSIEVFEDFNLIPPALKILGNVMFGINAAVVMFCAIWLYFKRQTKQVKVMQPFFLSMVLLGCLVSSSTILALGIEGKRNESVDGCMLIPWLYSVGYSITIGTLFAKIRRIYIIFKSAAKMRRKVVTVGETVRVIGIIFLVDVAILTAWTIVSPLEWERIVLDEDFFGEPLESVGNCLFTHVHEDSTSIIVFASLLAAFHFFLICISCYMCYVSRNVSTKFSEGKYLAIAMVSNLQIFVVGLPVLVIVGSDPDSSYFVRCAIVWMNDLVVVLMIFGNLIWSVYQDKEINIGKAIKQASQQMSQVSQGSLSRVKTSTEFADSSERDHVKFSDVHGNSAKESDYASSTYQMEDHSSAIPMEDHSSTIRMEERHHADDDDSMCSFASCQGNELPK